MSSSHDDFVPEREGYDSETETYHVRDALERPQPISVTVVQTVAAVTGTEPEDVEPLYDVIDPNALDALFRPVSEGSSRRTASVSFTLHGLDVTVHASGEIVVAVPRNDERGILDAVYDKVKSCPLFDRVPF